MKVTLKQKRILLLVNKVDNRIEQFDLTVKVTFSEKDVRFSLQSTKFEPYEFEN